MKVCTDACIFGAVVSAQAANNPPIKNVLDIGTGTGLLSLMMAQKKEAPIDAIEIDTSAFLQAAKNFKHSPWSKKLTILNTDVLEFYPEKKYDLIISNPPFYEGDLKSDNRKKNAAKHDTTLTLEKLLQAIDRCLSPGGSFAVLVPYHRINFFIELANTSGFFLNQQLLVQHTAMHPFFRGILFFSRNETAIQKQGLIIKNEMGTYTTAFTDLMKDYYL